MFPVPPSLTNGSSLIHATWLSPLLFVGRYVLIAGLVWLLAYVIFRRKWSRRKIIAKYPRREEVWAEIRYSIMTCAIFAAAAVGTLWAARQGWTQMYYRIEDHSRLWFWLSGAVAILIHDAYFYWTHRLMHLRWFYRLFHKIHHRFRNPTPWAAYAFSPLEAVVQAASLPLIAFVIPMHPIAWCTFLAWQIIFNVLGHSGFEFSHPRFMDWPTRFFISTATNHVMHHESMRGNYGLYFNFWDRLMGTNLKDYEQRFREVTSSSRKQVE